ncbi:MAG: tRNA pseudouridine(55) synthase TruB [Elusimicrobiota bacterium]
MEPGDRPVEGLLLIDKPSGPTSYDCVHHVKRISGQPRVGHCGTLDPLAQGVLILLLGRATKQQDAFLGMEKQYWFRAQFGILTDTGDREGKRLQTMGVLPLESCPLQTVLTGFVGEHGQIPPRYSALKYKGKPYYHWARRGMDIPRVPRPVQIHSFELLKLDGAFWEARVTCSRGTYIRTLVEEVAQRLGTIATLEALVRERVGNYRREAALSWDRLLTLDREGLRGYCEPNIRTDTRNI